MTLFSCVMAFAAVRQAGSYAELQSALSDADCDEIQLTADFGYPTNGSGLINITKSITINGKDNDGNIHTISGWGNRSNNKTTIAINNSGTNFVSVVLKDLIIRNAGASGRPIETRGKITSLTLDNVKVYATGTGNCQGITIGGAQSTAANFTMTNSEINVGGSSYAIISFNPYIGTITDSKINAWAGLYFRGVSSSYGSRGTTVNATRTTFNCPNTHSGRTNAFGAFVTEDDGITLNVTNCDINSSATGDQAQSVFIISTNWNIWQDATYRPTGARPLQPIALVIDGDNTHIDMNGYYYTDINVKAVETFKNSSWYKFAAKYSGSQFDEYMIPFSVTMTGGTYDVNPYYYRHVTKVNRDEDGKPIKTEDGGYSVVAQSPIIPAGYAVIEVEDGGKTRYRIIHTDNISYNINGNYEEEGAGDNPTTSFIVEAADAENAKIELVNNATEAAYVQVRDNGDDVATTLAVGKMDGEDKVNQTLVVNNGLDVQGNSQVTVQPGSTLQIGEGGIVTEKPENIVIEANEEGAASLIMDPAITVNQTPNLTVRMTAKQIGRNADGDFLWHRFAMPVAATIISWDKEGSLAGTTTYPTYIYAWDYSANDWANLSGVEKMVPLQGYTLTLASNWINYDGETATDAETETGNLNVPQDVVYTFKGNLVGNTDQALNFQHEGFNFFGNSYTGYMSVLNLISGIESDKIEDVIYMWNADQQKYVGVSLYKLQTGKGLKNWQKEVAPMQTFIMRLRGADSVNESVNYSSSIWGNPRYGNSGSNPAPRRRMPATIEEDTYMEITVTAANGQSDVIDFAESASNTDAFENGYDVVKFMNEHTLNLYTTLAGEEFSSVVTDNLEGKTLNLKTNSELSYTISFENVEGEEYALRDNATGAIIAIENGVTYEFAAQPNSTVEGRFEIISVAKMPTAIENTEVKANAKGIYTIMGQYLGEDFEALPAGVYVVNGVKIVK